MTSGSFHTVLIVLVAGAFVVAALLCLYLAANYMGKPKTKDGPWGESIVEGHMLRRILFGGVGGFFARKMVVYAVLLLGIVIAIAVSVLIAAISSAFAVQT